MSVLLCLRGNTGTILVGMMVRMQVETYQICWMIMVCFPSSKGVGGERLVLNRSDWWTHPFVIT